MIEPIKHNCHACGKQIDEKDAIQLIFQDFSTFRLWCCPAQDCVGYTVYKIQGMKHIETNRIPQIDEGLHKRVEDIFRAKLEERK
jgi:hypothetical protein